MFSIQLFIVLLLFATFDITASTKYFGDQLWRIQLDDQGHMELIQQITKGYKIDLWLPTRKHHPIDLHIKESQIDHVRKKLNQNGISYKVIQSDIGRLIQKQISDSITSRSRVKSLSEFDYSIYHTANEINNWMDLVVSEVTYTTKVQYGVSYEGRPLYALKLSKSSNKPTIYVDSLIHSREWVTAAAAMFAFQQIMFNSTFSWLVDDINWIFVPMVNIDGYMYTWRDDGDRLWRQTRSTGASSTTECMGADPNRNWDSHWEELLAASDDPCAQIYHGREPQSESEVRHLSNFILENKDTINAVVTLHSYAQAVVFPYNYQRGKYPTNSELQNKTASAMSEAMRSLYGTDYKFGAAAETLYEATGVTTDWTQDIAGIDINYTIELRDTGEYGFLLPPDQIIPTGEELLAALQVLAHRVSSIRTDLV